METADFRRSKFRLRASTGSVLYNAARPQHTEHAAVVSPRIRSYRQRRAQSRRSGTPPRSSLALFSGGKGPGPASTRRSLDTPEVAFRQLSGHPFRVLTGPRPCRTPPPPGRRSDAARWTSRSCACTLPSLWAMGASAPSDARLRFRLRAPCRPSSANKSVDGDALHSRSPDPRRLTPRPKKKKRTAHTPKKA